MTGFHYLSDQVLESVGISQQEIADAIESALLAQAAGEIWTAPKAAVLPGDGRYMMTTLSVSDAPQVIAVKAVSVSPRNPDRGLSAINGAITLFDSETGLLKAVLDANWVTAVRTAGLSAVAARRLADPKSRTIAFVGCGVQAHSHLDAFAAMFPLAEVRAVGRGQANIERLCKAARDRDLEARACTDPREALDGADLVVTSVTLNYDTEPFLDARWLKAGAFAAITDLGIPWHKEGMPAFANIVIDDRVQEAASPTPLVDPALVTCDLKELVSGNADAAFAPDRRACFIFRGIAIGDFAIAALGYERAMAKGVGTLVEG